MDRHHFHVVDIDSSLSESTNKLPDPQNLIINKLLVGKGVGLGNSYFIIDSNEINKLPAVHTNIKNYINGTSHNSEPDGFGGQKVFWFEKIKDEKTLLKNKLANIFIERVPKDKRSGKFWKYRRVP